MNGKIINKTILNKTEIAINFHDGPYQNMAVFLVVLGQYLTMKKTMVVVGI